MAYFRDRSDIDLDALTDEELIEHMRTARQHGHPDSEALARRVLAFRYFDQIESRTRAKLDHEPDSTIEEIRDATLESIFKAEIDGESIGEFKSFMATVLARRIADHYRRHPPDTEPLADELGDEEDGPPGAIISGAEFAGFVLANDVVNKVMAMRSAQHHRVIKLYVLDRFSARETCEIVNEEFAGEGDPMTEPNVNQIGSRFRRDLRDELEGGAP